MPSDLHYTPAEIARLRDEATPGPWRWDDGRGERGCDEGGITSDSGWLLWLGDSEPYENSHGWCRRHGDRAMLAAAPALASDLLTLHGRVADLEDDKEAAVAMLSAATCATERAEAHIAALREQADRMRAALLALADGFDVADRHDDREDYDVALQAIFDSARGFLADPCGGTLHDVGDALRALAGEASR